MKFTNGSGHHSTRDKDKGKIRSEKADVIERLREMDNAVRSDAPVNEPEEGRNAAALPPSGAVEEHQEKSADAPEHKKGKKKKAGTKKGTKKSDKRIWGILAIVLGCIVLLGLIAFAAVQVWTDAPEINMSGLTTKEPAVTEKPGDMLATPEPTPTPKPEATPEPEKEEETVKTGRREGVYTVLVVGQDVAGMNTDTIMVATMDTMNHTLNVVSIPRDTLVNVTWAVKKINSVYGMTGTEEGLLQGISEILGYKVDSYVIVNIYAFEQVIDAIGGVDFDVPMHISWGDPTIGKSYDIPAGMQHLDGYNALGVVRFRKNTDGSGYPTGDIGRVETQQRFAIAAAKKMLSLGNIPNLGKIINIVTDNLKTNLTSGNMAFYAQEFLKLDPDGIEFSVMPYEPVYIKGGSYVSVNLGEWMQMLNEKLNPYYEPITEGNLDVLTFSNGSFYSTTGILAGGYDSFYDYTALIG